VRHWAWPLLALLMMAIVLPFLFRSVSLDYSEQISPYSAKHSFDTPRFAQSLKAMPSSFCMSSGNTLNVSTSGLPIVRHRDAASVGCPFRVIKTVDNLFLVIPRPSWKAFAWKTEADPTIGWRDQCRSAAKETKSCSEILKSAMKTPLVFLLR